MAHTAPPAPRVATWRPLLRGPAADRARAAVDAVADALRDPRRLPPAHEASGNRALTEAAGGDASLASGHAGLALFFAQLARRSRRAADRDAAVVHLNRAFDVAASLPRLGLFSGLAGVAFAATAVARLLPGAAREAADAVDAVDDVLVDGVSAAAWVGPYDLIEGLAGLGAVCLERAPRPAALAALAHVVRHLEELAEQRPDGVVWPTPGDRLPPHQRPLAPAGYVNTGAAHGSPAVIAVLAAAAALGAGTPATDGLVAGAVRWLLDRRSETDAASVLPCWVPLDERPSPSARLAWCYGDAGAAACLLSAARHAGRPDWRDEALAVARRAATVSLAVSGARDAGLCHGTAGLAHLFQLMHRETGDPVLARAARAWFDHTLDLRRTEGGVAGYFTWAPDDAGDLGWTVDRGFLGGAAGVALALLGGLSACEPHWSRALVPSLPPEDMP